METHATYCEYPKRKDEYLELPNDLYIREWHHEDHRDPTDAITRATDAKSFKLVPGLYVVRGFSSVTMMKGLAPIIDTGNAYPGCCYVYDVGKWPTPPRPAQLEEFLETAYAVGGIAVAMYSGSSLFECVIDTRRTGELARVAVGHQVGYDPEKAVNKVYARVGGGDSTYHLAAKISIYKMV